MTWSALTERRLEVVSTVLLALATVATAWAAYRTRFRPGLKFVAWLATRPFTNRGATLPVMLTA